MAVVLCAFLVPGGGGCAHRVYRADNLPATAVAPPVEDIQMANLSHLERYAESSQRIEGGDVLEVTIASNYAEMPATPMPVRVRDDGTASVPLIGEVAIGGLELEDAEQAIASAAVYRDVFHHPHVTVLFLQQRMNRVTVAGDGVERPGVFELPRGSSTLLAAVVTAGILTEQASPNIQIHRAARPGGTASRIALRFAADEGARQAFHAERAAAGTETIHVNLAGATLPGGRGYYVDDGDVVIVNKRNRKPVRVLGLVRKPDQYDMPSHHDLYLLDALAMSGGRTSQLADTVLIIRQLPGQPEPVRIAVSVREAKAGGAANLRLAEGDVVSVEETPTTWALDTLRSFFRFSVGSSMVLF